MVMLWQRVQRRSSQRMRVAFWGTEPTVIVLLTADCIGALIQVLVPAGASLQALELTRQPGTRTSNPQPEVFRSIAPPVVRVTVAVSPPPCATVATRGDVTRSMPYACLSPSRASRDPAGCLNIECTPPDGFGVSKMVAMKTLGIAGLGT